MPKSKSSRVKPQQTDSNAHQLIAKALGFVSFCTNAHCRRARECRGEGHPCFAAFWPHVAEETKAWLRATMKALADGADEHAALAAGEAASERRQAFDAAERARQTASLNAVQTPRHEQPCSETPRREPPQPRIRAL